MHRFALTVTTLFSLALGACSPHQAPAAQAPESRADASTATPQAPGAVPTAAVSAKPAPAALSTAGAALPLVVVHKSESCGCCTLWVEHMQDAGFQVQVRNSDDLGPIKERVGVPHGKGSCHTAEVGGYFVEGHVPAEDIKQLLASRPDAKGLTVPGMPLGSPGMEAPDGRVQPYAVELVGNDGGTRVFARHGE